MAFGRSTIGQVDLVMVYTVVAPNSYGLWPVDDWTGGAKSGRKTAAIQSLSVGLHSVCAVWKESVVSQDCARLLHTLSY